MSGLVPTAGLLLGLALVFLGERVAGAGPARTALSCAGAGLALAALALRAWRLVRARGAGAEGRRTLERWLLLLTAAAVLGLGLYALQADFAAGLYGGASGRGGSRLATALAALFPAVLLGAVLPLVLAEAAARSMERAPVLELARVRDAALTGLGLALAVVFAFAAQYVATERDVTRDLSYFRPARPGTATRALARGLNEPVTVALFFPPASEVGDRVRGYFRELGEESPQLRVEALDQAVDLARARALGVSQNGAVVLERGGKREQILVGTELERARSALGRLDEDVHKRLRQVARPRRTVYLTGGHGERAERAPAAAPVGEAAGAPAGKLRELLRALNNEVKPLTAAEGLGVRVPEDAGLVVVLGPVQPFGPGELEALAAYFARGGRLLVALEPDGADVVPLLQALGVQAARVPLANAQVYYPVARAPGDVRNLGTANFSSHPAVATLSGRGDPVGFFGAGALDVAAQAPAGVRVDVAVRAHAATFADKDGGFTQGPGEEARAWPLVIASERVAGAPGAEPGRALVLGDADALADVALTRVPGNALLAVDAAHWLLGEEALSGRVETDEDPPVQHTRGQDAAWFYGTVFLVPLAVLGLGFLATRRRGVRGARRAGATVPGAGTTTSDGGRTE